MARFERELGARAHEMRIREDLASAAQSGAGGTPSLFINGELYQGSLDRDDVFAAITARAGRTFWLNPEPRLYWNYGDSVIAAYEQHCTAFECWRTDQLEEFVKALTRPVVT